MRSHNKHMCMTLQAHHGEDGREYWLTLEGKRTVKLAELSHCLLAHMTEEDVAILEQQVVAGARRSLAAFAEDNDYLLLPVSPQPCDPPPGS